MQVEIEVVGTPIKWTLNKAAIRIGRGSKCDVALPARQFPGVNILHAELDESDGALRLTPRDGSPTQLMLNGEPAETGDVILSGDILRLGPSGPELRIAYASQAPSDAYVATRVISVDEVPGREATRLMNVAGHTVEAPAQPSIPAARPARPAAPEPPRPVAQSVRPAGGLLDRFAEKREQWPATNKPAAGAVPSKAPASPAAGAASSPLPDPDLIARLRNLQIMQGVALAIIVLLGIWVFQLRRDLSTTQDDVRALRAQDQNAVGQLMPSLDARLNGFGQRMDSMDTMFKNSETRMEKGMDAKMKEAEDQLFNNLDARMKTTEDRMVNRMNTELPPLLDKYITAKLGDIKH